MQREETTHKYKRKYKIVHNTPLKTRKIKLNKTKTSKKTAKKLALFLTLKKGVPSGQTAPTKNT